jgi:hypothetical protein
VAIVSQSSYNTTEWWRTLFPIQPDVFSGLNHELEQQLLDSSTDSLQFFYDAG